MATEKTITAQQFVAFVQGLNWSDYTWEFSGYANWGAGGPSVENPISVAFLKDLAGKVKG